MAAGIRRSIIFEGITVTLLILLVFMLIAMIMGASGGPSERSIPGSDQVQYIYTGGNNTLYMFFDDHIQAIDMRGNELWDFKIPEQWQICYGWHFIPMPYIAMFNPLSIYDTKRDITTTEGGPITYSDNGTLYIYLMPNATFSGTPMSSAIDKHMGEGLVAISSRGNVLWSLPLQSNMINEQSAVGPSGNYGMYMNFSDANIFARNGTVYVFHDYTETVVNATSGKTLWSVDNVASPVSVDENGYVYCVPAVRPDAGYTQPLFNATSTGTKNDHIEGMSAELADYQVPSAIVDAYYPNGTQYWREYPGEQVYRQYINDERLPLFNNGTVYVPLQSGIMAFYTNGTKKWETKYDPGDFPFQSFIDEFGNTVNVIGDFSLYSPMPFDSKGDVYLQYVSRESIAPTYENGSYSSSSDLLYLITIGPDGHEIARDKFYVTKYVAASDGIGFATSQSLSPQYYMLNASNLTTLQTESLIAYNIKNGTELWNYTFSVTDPSVVTLDDTNAKELMPFYSGWNGAVNESPQETYVAQDNLSIVKIPEVITSDGRIYAQFYSLNYQSPFVLGQSKAAYVSGVYALDENESLLWNRTVSVNAYDMNVVNNSTVFYRDGNGNLIVTGAGAAIGFALTTILYIFIRFFCIGAVARARSRINKNVNRNAVYDFIAKNPGLTLYELSRGLGMNLGTVRYHLFILGLNHRIVPYDGESKFVRYFTNSNSYSREDQAIVSLMRRESYGKVLEYMLMQPVSSNVEIAMKLGLKESLVSRCIKELSEKGIVVKEPSGSRNFYTLDNSHRERIANAIRCIGGDQ